MRIEDINANSREGKLLAVAMDMIAESHPHKPRHLIFEELTILAEVD